MDLRRPVQLLISFLVASSPYWIVLLAFLLGGFEHRPLRLPPPPGDWEGEEAEEVSTVSMSWPTQDEEAPPEEPPHEAAPPAPAPAPSPVKDPLPVQPAETTPPPDAPPQPDSPPANPEAPQGDPGSPPTPGETTANTDGPGSAERTVVKVAPTKKKKKGKKCEDALAGIRQVEEGYYQIDRELVQALAGDLEALDKLAYVTWHHDADGKIDGFLLKRVRCGALHQAGLRTGDIVMEINGRRVRNLGEALLTWRKVRKKDVVKVEIVRNGKPLKLRYEIVEVDEE